MPADLNTILQLALNCVLIVVIYTSGSTLELLAPMPVLVVILHLFVGYSEVRVYEL